LNKIINEKRIDRLRKEQAVKRTGIPKAKDNNLGAAEGNPTGRLADQAEIPLDEFPSKEPSPEFIAMQNEEVQRLREKLAGDKHRQIFDLMYAGNTKSEIALIMKISRASVIREWAIMRKDMIN